MKYLERYAVLLGVMIFLLSPFLLSPFSIYESLQYPQQRQLVAAKITVNLLLAGIFYFNLRVLTPRLLEQKRVGEFIFILTGLLLGFMIFDSSIMHYGQNTLPPRFRMGPADFSGPPPPPRPGADRFGGAPQIVGNLITFMVTILSSSMMVLLRERLREKEIRQQVEFEKVKAELSVLKLQISPHFLFNTLNNIRYLARKKSDKTEEAVIELAQLLRYMIYQVNDEFVPLLKEIEHLQRYINLQRMRLQNHTTVQFSYSGNYHSQNIEPLLFIPFVENAFKYGVHAHEPSLIQIEIIVSDTGLMFRCENDIFAQSRKVDSDASGVGIANVRKRLHLYYPSSHDLRITDVEGIYSVQLSLQFRRG
ncbi:sensor histidine kinase [Dyadobacter tibetensis]|uniref:sensor histidine kinase n=1 Tax=Dyadobacter tibetensis TaxID=1211851 RepID=UPI0004712F45|nr:sensor histidine kinase [Dyadobacter tibetensis]